MRAGGLWAVGEGYNWWVGGSRVGDGLCMMIMYIGCLVIHLLVNGDARWGCFYFTFFYFFLSLFSVLSFICRSVFPIYLSIYLCTYLSI